MLNSTVVYMYKIDLVSNNLKCLIWYAIKPNQTKHPVTKGE